MMFAKTMVEIMITTNATMMTRHPKSLRTAVMKRSTMSCEAGLAEAQGYVKAVSVPRPPPGPMEPSRARSEAAAILRP